MVKQTKRQQDSQSQSPYFNNYNIDRHRYKIFEPHQIRTNLELLGHLYGYSKVFHKEKFGFLISQIIKNSKSDEELSRGRNSLRNIVNKKMKNNQNCIPKDLYFNKQDFKEFLKDINNKQLISDAIDSVQNSIGQYTIKEDNIDSSNLIQNLLQRFQDVLMQGLLKCKNEDLKQIREEILILYGNLEGTTKKLINYTRKEKSNLNGGIELEEYQFHLTEAEEQEDQGQQMSHQQDEQKQMQTQQVDNMINNTLKLDQTDNMIIVGTGIVLSGNENIQGLDQTYNEINFGTGIVLSGNENIKGLDQTDNMIIVGTGIVLSGNENIIGLDQTDNEINVRTGIALSSNENIIGLNQTDNEINFRTGIGLSSNENIIGMDQTDNEINFGTGVIYYDAEQTQTFQYTQEMRNDGTQIFLYDCDNTGPYYYINEIQMF
ncbi:unnamed protein product [Paramecium octaurelia]|uniref:Uncharacterized protein n=1 Tax=Paramecium octaurelia TaxID=43137 RepID=A0A8S1XDS1_PAROT|nr:unnamed protein product [Paramecium octaurelia]